MTMNRDLHPVDYSGLKCLIVDDNPISLMFMRKILHKYRVITLEANDVQGALHRLSSEAVECVITDLHLLDGTGQDILNYVRSTEDLQHVSVYSATASIIDPKNEAGFQFDGKLGKPFTENELLALLGRHDEDFQRLSK